MIVETKIKNKLDKIYDAAIKAASPLNCISEYLISDDKYLYVGDRTYSYNKYKNIYVISFGKAAFNMAKGTGEILKNKIKEGLIISNTIKCDKLSGFRFLESSHPVPNQRSINAAKEIIKILNKTDENDLIIFLISGGGSSIVALPEEGISLEDKKLTTEILLKSGIDINTLNAVRKRISLIKGGGLLKYSYPTDVISLIISDVVGDNIDVIASGPTVPDKSDFKVAWQEIVDLGIHNKLPKKVFSKLEGIHKDKLKDTKISLHNTVIVGNNLKSLKSAKERAEELGYDTRILNSEVIGETKLVAKDLATEIIKIKKQYMPLEKPLCLIIGGETTVKVKGKGLGGRNSEFALAFAIAIKNESKISALFAGTDGIDGPTDAAGAYCNGNTITEVEKIGINGEDKLLDNDSYTFFHEAGNLKITGPSGTNVNDIGIILIDK
tara:strand:- start:238 stop:1554 length:1317 start_codon:yes stop_codon:yes gene_type:complete